MQLTTNVWMRSLLLASCCSMCVSCQTTTPPAGFPDVGRHDAGLDADLDGGSSDMDAPRPDDTGMALDVGADDTGVSDVDGAVGDAGGTVDSGGTFDSGGTVDSGGSIPVDSAVDSAIDAGMILVDQDARVVSGCISHLHLTGHPLGTAAYDWSGCGVAETQTTGSPWAESLIVEDSGVAFFHSGSVPSGSAQAVSGTFLLPAMSAPSPFAIVCAGTGSTVDVDGSGSVTAFAFQGTTTLNTRTNTSGGLAISFGTSTTLNGDLGSHHFAVTADSTTGTNLPVPDARSVLITSGSTTLSVLYVTNGSMLVYALVQVASGSTTDVYEATSGSATSTSITLAATVSLLGSCVAGTGTGSLSGTLTP